VVEGIVFDRITSVSRGHKSCSPQEGLDLIAKWEIVRVWREPHPLINDTFRPGFRGK
jgi:hypothetical protein